MDRLIKEVLLDRPFRVINYKTKLIGLYDFHKVCYMIFIK